MHIFWSFLARRKRLFKCLKYMYYVYLFGWPWPVWTRHRQHVTWHQVSQRQTARSPPNPHSYLLMPNTRRNNKTLFGLWKKDTLELMNWNHSMWMWSSLNVSMPSPLATEAGWDLSSELNRTLVSGELLFWRVTRYRHTDRFSGGQTDRHACQVGR